MKGESAMPTTEILTDSRYKKLLTDLRKILQEGRRAALAAASQVLVETTWRLGKRVKEERLTEQAGYGDSLMEDLAEDLEMDVTALRRAVIFFEQNEKSAPRRINLTMAHHQELLALADPGERAFYMELADSRALTRDELRRAIKRGDYEAGDGISKRARSLNLKRPSEATYVYKAVVERIVDGDTLLVQVDLGFGLWTRQYLRLRGIDCPEIETSRGRQAKQFVESELSRVPYVTISSSRSDKYDRYLSDVFYSVSGTEYFLNNELLARRHAVRMDPHLI